MALGNSNYLNRGLIRLWRNGLNENQQAILLMHVQWKRTYSRRNLGWLDYRLNKEGEVLCPVCSVGMVELRAVHAAYENCPELQCRYFFCQRSGITFFGDEEGLSFVSYSQGILNLAREEGAEWESILQVEQSMPMRRSLERTSGQTEKQLRELLAKSLTRRSSEK